MIFNEKVLSSLSGFTPIWRTKFHDFFLGQELLNLRTLEQNVQASSLTC